MKPNGEWAVEDTAEALPGGLASPTRRLEADALRRLRPYSAKLEADDDAAEPGDGEAEAGAGGAHQHSSASAFLALAFGSLGVVYGDLATSPLYAFSSLFQTTNGAQRVPSEEDIKGGLASFFWALVACCTLKYQVFLMSANDNGEGGLFAMLNSLRCRGNLQGKPRLWRGLQALTIAGVALMTVDGLLTSAVSVTSAVEGIGLRVDAFQGATDPNHYRNTCSLSAAILVLIFGLQSVGSAGIGKVFSPVMFTWLLFIAVIGAINISRHPSVFAALSPRQLGLFWSTGNYKGVASWRALGGVVLCLTGSEALYADMGHFGRGPIAAAWGFVVFPCLVAQYTGQSAFLLSNLAVLQPAAADGSACAAAWYTPAGPSCGGGGGGGGALAPQSCCDRFTAAQSFISLSFWHSMPNQATYTAMLVVATLASVVGSQSTLSGVFTLYSQASALGLFPPVEVVHTSGSEEGQVYCPSINRAMAVASLFLLGAFQRSANLTAVFSAVVACVFLVDSTLRLAVAWRVQRWRPLALAAVGAPLLLMDGALASANVDRYFTAGPSLLGGGDPNGRDAWIAYVPFVIFVLIGLTMALWLWGQRHAVLGAAVGTAALLALGDDEGDGEASAAPPPRPITPQGAEPHARSAAADALMSALAGVRAGAVTEPPPLQPTPLEPAAPFAPNPLRPTAKSASFASFSTLGGGGVVIGGGGGSFLFGAPHPPRRPSHAFAGPAPLRPGDKTASFAAAFASVGVPPPGGMEEAGTHAQLGRALASLSQASRLARPPAVGLFVTSTRSLLDTEALPREEGDAESSASHHSPSSSSARRRPPPRPRPLELPPAFLHAVARRACLPRLAIVLEVEFTPGVARCHGSLRTRVRRVPLAPGVYHITLRYGWAERPRSHDEVCAALLALGRAAAARFVSDGGTTHHPGLAALSHMRCSVPPSRDGDAGAAAEEDPRRTALTGFFFNTPRRDVSGGSGCGGGCVCTTPGAGPCLPVTFVVGRDALAAPRGAGAFTRAAAALFTALASLSGSLAEQLQLPRDAVVEACQPITLADAAGEEGRSGEEGDARVEGGLDGNGTGRQEGGGNGKFAEAAAAEVGAGGGEGAAAGAAAAWRARGSAARPQHLSRLDSV